MTKVCVFVIHVSSVEAANYDWWRVRKRNPATGFWLEGKSFSSNHMSSEFLDKGEDDGEDDVSWICSRWWLCEDMPSPTLFLACFLVLAMAFVSVSYWSWPCPRMPYAAFVFLSIFCASTTLPHTILDTYHSGIRKQPWNVGRKHTPFFMMLCA